VTGARGGKDMLNVFFYFPLALTGPPIWLQFVKTFQKFLVQ